MAQRLTRKLTEVASEVERQIKAHYNITQKMLDSFLTLYLCSGQNYVQSDLQQRLVKLKVGGRAKVFRQGFPHICFQ